MNENKNEEKHYGNIELRILILGDEKVGKKTLTKRIHMLNSSSKKIIDQEITLYQEHEENKRKERMQKLIQELLKERQIYGNYNYEYRDEETIKNVEIQLKKEQERKKLMSVQKIFKFSFYNNIKINVYPCIEMEILADDDTLNENENETLNEFEKKNNKSIKGLMYEVYEVISKSTENLYDKVEILFLFCFDLSNYETFENISLCYNELNKYLDIKNNYNFALIGNKKDKIKVMNEKQKKTFNKFIENTNMKYYEISSLLNFNFENFFEKLFFDIFETNSNYNFNSKDLREKFHLLINERTKFSKSGREVKLKDMSPSPNKYYNNPFEYPLSKRNILNIFKDKFKYNKKIFINKNGPVYPILTNEKEKEKERQRNIEDIKNMYMGIEIKKKKLNKGEANTSIEKNKNKLLEIDIDSNTKRNLKNYLEPYSYIKGYSFSGNKNIDSLGLRESRRKINFEKIKEINEAINSELNLTRKSNKTLKKINSFDKNKAILLNKEENKEKLIYEKILKERHHNINLMNESLEKERINKILEKEKMYSKKYLQKKKNLYLSKLKSIKNQIKTSLSQNSRIKYDEPKAKFYDTISSISLKKGFSFGHKPTKNENIKIFTPEFSNILDDFEKIVNKNKNKPEIKSHSNRFPIVKIDEVGDSREMMEEKQKIYEKKRKALKKKALSDFFESMKLRKNEVLLKKRQMSEKEKEDYKKLVNNNYYLTEIQYNQVETSYPKYSIKGKNYLNKDKEINNLIYENEFMEDGKVYKKFNYEESPDISKVRPNNPKYSFGKCERFKKTLSDLGKNNINLNSNLNDEQKENQNILFRNGIFGYIDKQSFSKTQNFMGKEEKLKNYKDNGIPGPGQYYIKGFAELISLKNKKK